MTPSLRVVLDPNVLDPSGGTTIDWFVPSRDGKLVAAGVGITRLRRPGETVVRFSSTRQRVGFSVEAISSAFPGKSATPKALTQSG